MPKELIPEIEYCAFNLAIFLFCFVTEVIDDYTASIFKINLEFSFQDFIELISINVKSIPSINKEALLHAFFTFKRIFPDYYYYSDLFKISIKKIRKNSGRVNQISIS